MKSIYAPSIYDGEQYHHNAWLNIQNNTVLSINETAFFNEQLIYETGTLVPGFIDLQVNGGGGILLNNDPTIQGLETIIQAHRSLGTHELLATLITSDDVTIHQALDAVESAIKQDMQGLLGIHLEGPMINSLKRGIHFDKDIHVLNDQLLKEIQSRNLGKVLVTLAPETVDVHIITELKDAGITVFAGHSNATAEEAQKGLQAGISGFTHMFNAMPPMLSREPSILGVAISDRNSWGTIIHDGIHVDPIMVKIAIEAKHINNMILVTDAMATLGSNIDSFEFNGHTIYKEHNKLVNHEGKLAGAHVDLFTSLKNTMNIGYTFEQALQMITQNPAKALNLYPAIGSLKNGAKANINWINGAIINPVV